MPARIIAVANQKGGVGKTVTSINVATTLAARGRRTLLVDLDPQGHCGVGLGVDIEDLDGSTYELLKDERTSVADVALQPVEGLEHFEMVAANLTLALAERSLTEREALPNLALASKLRAVREDYDEIVLDCPPALGKLALNAFLACDLIIIPVGVGFFSIHGLRMLAETLRDIFDETGLDYEIRCLITRYRHNQTVSRDVREAAMAMFGDHCFSTVIRENIDLEKSIGAQEPLIKYAPNSAAGRDYRRLVDELLGQRTLERSAPRPRPAILAPPVGALVSEEEPAAEPAEPAEASS